jgi:hypothetical protein
MLRLRASDHSIATVLIRGVGSVLLARRTFLRTCIDVGALTAVHVCMQVFIRWPVFWVQRVEGCVC